MPSATSLFPQPRTKRSNLLPLLTTLFSSLCLSVSSHNNVASSLFVPVRTPSFHCRHRRQSQLTPAVGSGHDDNNNCQRHNINNIHAGRSTILYSSTPNEVKTNCDELKRILRRYGFGSRLMTLTNADLSERPMPAEMYEGGSWKQCLITGLRRPASSSNNGKENNNKPPLLDVLVMDDDGLLQENKVVDIGQITTIWQDFPDASKQSLQSNFNKAQQSLQNNILPVEKAMQDLYNGRIANRSRPPSHHNNNRYALTKKQIPKIASQSQCSDPSHLEELLRSLLKVGEDRISRLVDSTLATDYLYSDYCRDGDDELIIRRMVAAQVLTEDAVSGGRFKRRSCQFVSAQYNAEDNGEAQEVEVALTLINGGWISVDPSIKAGTEGRKAAQKFAAATSSSSNNSNDANESKNSNNVRKEPLILTAADERIAHRLECLAMGDAWSNDKSDQEEDTKMLEVDVREALTSMNLPLTPRGATSALIKIGRWSGNASDEKAKNRIEPWSPDLLDAARSLATYENKRRESLAKMCYSTKNKKGSKHNNHGATASLADGFEGRDDLTSLPCVCIDAKRASFRDDSIGIRLRSSTGRKVNKSASKWEVLIHIADISDIYFDGGKSFSTKIIVPSKNDVKDLYLLREAAERRGQSRYDLPLGPLHLLPPVVLTALSLTTNKEKTPNRCATLWAYIDERDGKLLEAGLERTIISSPTALSFADATSLLECNAEEVPKPMTNTKAVISVAERNLRLWSRRQRQRNQAAQKREKRLATKEFIANELNAASRTQARDDGVGDSFQRSRGHRMVDSSLDLYAFAVSSLMKRAKQPIPRAAGSGADRGGRLGTAPLRRYIDGLAQRQALSVLCGYGEPLTLDECKEASKVAARATDNNANLRSSKQSPKSGSNGTGNQRRQVSAIYELARHLASTGGIENQQRVKAMSTGHNNEVLILGVGAKARCKGVKGTLKSGEKLLVRVDRINAERGVLDVSLAR